MWTAVSHFPSVNILNIPQLTPIKCSKLCPDNTFQVRTLVLPSVIILPGGLVSRDLGL